MNAVDPYRLIINDDYEKLFQALCRGLPMPDGVSLQDLVDDLRMAARTLTEEWDQAVEVEGVPAARRDYAFIWGSIGALEVMIRCGI